jgi:hypothetical protein
MGLYNPLKSVENHKIEKLRVYTGKIFSLSGSS